MVRRPLDDVAQAVDAARFGVRLRGYDCAEVDALLDRLVVLLHPSSVPPSSPGDDTVSKPPAALAERTFKTVLRGWDPKEVHAYLVELEARVAVPPDAEADARHRADALVASARLEADAILGAARREADDIGRQQTAMDDWFGPQDAPGGGAGAVDRWGALGEHVARLLAQAESEAATIVAEAEARAATARAETDALLETAAASARDHVTEVLASAETRLEVSRAELVRLRAKLAEVHDQLGRSLEVVHDDRDLELQPASRFIDLGDPVPPVEATVDLGTATLPVREPGAPIAAPQANAAPAPTMPPVLDPPLTESPVTEPPAVAPQATDPAVIEVAPADPAALPRTGGWPFADPSPAPGATGAPADEAPLTEPQVTSTWP